MKKHFQFIALLAAGGLLMVNLAGCDKASTDSVENAVKKAENEVGKVAEQAGDAAKAAADSTSNALSKLGEQAMGFVNPLKDQFGKLEGLAGEPEKLKQAASDLISKLETDMSGMGLPEGITDALNVAKEKLIALRDYITDEADPAQIKEKINAVLESVKSSLGMG